MNRYFKITPFLVLLFLVQGVHAEWERQSTGSLAWFHTIHFADANTGWVGGSNGAILETLDGGVTWKNGVKFTSDTIKRIHFTDRQNGWALCERDIYSLGSDVPSYLMRTTDGGRSWKKLDFEDSNRRRITNIVFAQSGFGIALGEMGTFYALANDKNTWKKMASPTNYLMIDGAFAGELKGAIVGGGGTILFTEDAGVTWSPAVVSQKTRSMLKSVYFLDERYGWTVGANGSVYQTINGGKYWRLQNTRTAADLNAVYFADTANGWAVGEQGSILRSTTGGNVWVEDRSKSRNNLEDIQFFNGQGWIVGFGGTLLKYAKRGNVKRKPRLR